jgi:hypothetical protein
MTIPNIRPTLAQRNENPTQTNQDILPGERNEKSGLSDIQLARQCAEPDSVCSCFGNFSLHLYPLDDSLSTPTTLVQQILEVNSNVQF